MVLLDIVYKKVLLFSDTCYPTAKARVNRSKDFKIGELRRIKYPFILAKNLLQKLQACAVPELKAMRMWCFGRSRDRL